VLDSEAGGCVVHFLAPSVCGGGKEEKPSGWWVKRTPRRRPASGSVWQAFAANFEDLDAHLVVNKDRRFSAAVEVFQRDLLSGLADQARTKVSTA
jgi:hypothetical protein